MSCFVRVTTLSVLAFLACLRVEIVLSQDGDDVPSKSKGLQREIIETNIQGKRWALIVGINYAANQRGSGEGLVVSLQHAESDAKEFTAVLENHYGYQSENIRIQMGKDATQRSIIDSLREDWLCSNDVTEKDNVLVYFSGHGSEQRVEKGKEVYNGHKPKIADLISIEKETPSTSSPILHQHESSRFPFQVSSFRCEEIGNSEVIRIIETKR